MKLKNVLVCAAGGALLASATVYCAVPPGGSRGVAEAVRLAPEATVTAAQPEEGPLTVDARIGHDQVDAEGRTYVMLELRGREGAPGKVTPSSTALVLDTSGSMLGERLQRATDAVRAFVARAPVGDMVTLLGFSTQAYRIFGPLRIGPDAALEVNAPLAKVVAAGDTCLSCGVREGMRQVMGSGGVERVLVLSDGKATVGIDDIAGFRALAANCREHDIPVSTIGLGTDYNEKVLSALAADSNGLHHFVATAADLPAVFQREEARVRATVASAVSADVDLAPGVELVRVVGRPSTQTGQRVHVDVGPISAGDQRTVLLEVRVPTQSAAGSAVSVAGLSVHFHDAITGAERLLTRGVVTHVGAVPSALDPLVEMRLARAATGEALEKASALFEQGREQEALALLDQHIAGLSLRAEDVIERARTRRDPRAADIDRDLQRQSETARRTRQGFSKPKPTPSSRSAAIKSTAPFSVEASL